MKSRRSLLATAAAIAAAPFVPAAVAPRIYHVRIKTHVVPTSERGRMTIGFTLSVDGGPQAAMPDEVATWIKADAAGRPAEINIS